MRCDRTIQRLGWGRGREGAPAGGRRGHRLGGREHGRPRVPGAHFPRSATGVALHERRHWPALSRHRGLSVPREGFPGASGTEARVRELQRPFPSPGREGDSAGSGRAWGAPAERLRLGGPPSHPGRLPARTPQALPRLWPVSRARGPRTRGRAESRGVEPSRGCHWLPCA